MNTKEYITSGKLESYVFGALNTEAMTEVEKMCALYPEINQEKLNMEEALMAYVKTLATRPPRELKERIMKAIRAIPQEKISPVRRSEIKMKQKSIAPLLWAASIALIFGFGVNHFLDINGKNAQEADFKRMQGEWLAEKEDLAAHIAHLNDSLHHERNYSHFILNGDTDLIPLKGTEKYPKALVKLFYNHELSEYVLKTEALPHKPDDKQFQLWAIVGGEARDLGVLAEDLLLSDRIKLEDMGEIEAFALTIEPYGGSKSPTLDEMVVLGEVAS